MARPTLAELTSSATAAEEPSFISPGKTKPGGVDPLGLRQINFDLMDEVFPGLNNVARHIRPFVVVAWAWRRAHQRAQALGMATIKQGELQEFVDRIEVLYVLSQLLRKKETDLPGRLYLAPWLKEEEFEFGGAKWQQRRKARRLSTALSAPVYYGPGLKMLGWVTTNPEYPGVMSPTSAVAPALDAFEGEIAAILGHEAFSKFGAVTVTRDEAREWADLWPLDSITDAEARVMAELLIGSGAPHSRRLGCELMRSVAEYAKTTDTAVVRAAMTGAPSSYVAPEHLEEIRNAWRLLQIRQLFRLSLEALFHWTMLNLGGRPRSIDSLVTSFLDQVPRERGIDTAGRWVQSLSPMSEGPTELMERIEHALEEPAAGDLPLSISTGLCFCLTEVVQTKSHAEPLERLPLSRARKEALARAGVPVEGFMRHVLETWVLAQHAYWSVGRGLADARIRGKTLLRLRVILDEGGWTLTPGARIGDPPVPTRDRLDTALSLGRECGLFKQQAPAAQRYQRLAAPSYPSRPH